MKDQQMITLPHLTNDVVRQARKTKLCAYSVALEGWRRGLNLKWYTKDSEHFKDMVIFGVNPPGRLFSLSNGEHTHYFFRTRGDKITNEAVEIGSDKDETKRYLLNQSVPCPIGKLFSEEHSDEEVVEQSKTEVQYPLVVKPVDGSLGNGVITNIQNDEEFFHALRYVRGELEYQNIIVERYITGEEYRVYVIEDEVIAAYNRVPANVVGDGEHTIEELINRKNRERRKNARLHSCLIEVDIEITEFIEKAGYNYDSIPEEGELIYLREKTNVSSGGDPIDVTDTIPTEIKEVAVKALKAVPGLYHGGVDIIYDETTGIPPVVIELNPTAQIGGILYPSEGKARDIPKAIIDYYFPETKGIDTSKSKVYFDLNAVLEPLTDRSAIEVDVNDAPDGKLYAKRYTLKGKVRRNSFHQWMKEQAQALGLHGFVQRSLKDEVDVVVAGTNREKVREFRELLNNPPKKVKIRQIESERFEDPIKIGFEIDEPYNPKSFSSLGSAIYNMERELHKSQKRKDKLEKEIDKIVNSTSWKTTGKLRDASVRMKSMIKPK
ncbi:acylphosphatase [Alkalibacillus silvisoli]|uniref:Acylphosphatase n=1 Tax=Alkalibacillus silvisoli TaxID=392823 RepID=A0ABN1A5W1_9BACI